MDVQTLRQFESKCIQDEPPACQTMCPLHLEARTLARLMAEGKIREARKILDRYLPLSGLTAYLCEGPCRPHCRRSEIDQGLDIALLERACVRQSSSARPLAMPATGKKVGLVGGGLSSLVAAWELARKGHQVTIHHYGPVGGWLLSLPPEQLPPEALAEALDHLARVKVAFQALPGYTKDELDRIRNDFPVVYLGFDDPALSPVDLELQTQDVLARKVTLATALPNVFAYPMRRDRDRKFIWEMAAGRRAAGSIDRVLQGGAPDTAREGEGTYPTRLYTDISAVKVQPRVVPADPLAPTADEARDEAARCLQCQCLECVKKCVYLHHYQGYPKKYAREIYNNISTAFGHRKANTMINSCAECGLCARVCPKGADMGDFIDLARREMVAGKHMPVSAHEFALEDQVYSNSPEVSFLRHQPGTDRSEWLFFPGCQLPASLPEQTAMVYQHLTGSLSGGVGLMLACCGAPGRWSGRPRLTGETAAFLRENWEAAGQPKLILACPSCAMFFENELAEIPFETLWSILAARPLPDNAATVADPALHDPCAGREDEPTKTGVRQILAAIGQSFEEPPLSGRLTRCCGYGGLADAANPELGRRFVQVRADDTDKPFVTYCIMCRDRLERVGKPALHLLDLLFPVLTPGEAAVRRGPGISDRQEGRLNFRRAALRGLWGEEAPPENEMDAAGIKDLNISPLVAANLEKRRILRSDIAAVLKYAEENGPQFHNQESGRSLAALRPRQVTFWVEYSRRDDGTYDIHDAYCHRMVTPGVPGAGAESPASREGFDLMGGRK